MSATSQTGVKPTHEQIAARAYELWERDDCKIGLDAAHWHQAEKELLEAAQPAKRTAVPVRGEKADGVHLTSAPKQARARAR